LIQYIHALFLFGVKLFLKEILEKEDFKYKENNKQLDQDNYPNTFSPP
jgi:hypothetical protein